MLFGRERQEGTISNLVGKSAIAAKSLSRVACAALGIGTLVAPDVVHALSTTSIVSSATTDINTAQLLNQRDRDYSLLRTTEEVKTEEVITLTNGVFYPIDGRTEGFGIEGFSVTGVMNEIYQTQGGQTKWGKPISQEYKLGEGRYQAFEKGIFQLLPEGKGGGWGVNFVNVFDELSKLGKDEWLKVVRSTPTSFDWSSDVGKPWGHTPEGSLPGTIEENHLQILNSYPALKTAYQVNPAWFEQSGLPMAVEDFGTFVAVRGQRAVLQLWLVDAPWASKGQVVMANGGSVAVEAGGLVPLNALKPQAIDRGTFYSREVIRELGDGRIEVRLSRRQDTISPSYYSQFEHADGIAVRANSSVNPEALKIAANISRQLLAKVAPEYRQKFLSRNPAFLVIPKNEPFYSLPELKNYFAASNVDPSKSYPVRGYALSNTKEVIPYVPDLELLVALVGEEILTGPDSSGVAGHEFSHSLYQTLPTEMQQQWQDIYSDAAASGRASRLTLCDIAFYGSAQRCGGEYWAELSRMYLQNIKDKIAQEDPAAFAFLQRVYH